MRTFCLLVLSIGLLASSASALDNEAFKKDMTDFFMRKAGPFLSIVPPEVQELLPYTRGIARTLENPFPKSELNLVCNTCITLIDSALDAIDSGSSMEGIIDSAVEICLNLQVFSEAECEGVVSNYAPELVYMHANQKLSGETTCAVLLGKDCGAWVEINDFTIAIDANKPAVEEPTLPTADSPSMRVLHLSDFHLDLTYTLDAQGSGCGGMQCCTNDTIKATGPENAAGYWGDYNCDVPVWTLADMLDHIKEEHGGTFDYIMMTGDYPAHDVYRQGRQINLDHAAAAVNEVLRVFPDTPVYPALGNHESFPCNSFPSTEVTDPEFENSWLYDGLGGLYSQWLDAAALESFMKDGFYSMKVNDGFRFIAMNSIYCYTFNFWLNWNTKDPVNQLQWLHDELLAAEAAGERVHILSHVPTGHGDCLGGWAREFSRIINRFENTVTAQFYGHTHNDEYIVYYEEGTKRPTNIAFITPSVTTWSTLNPAFRFYTIDGGYEGATMRVLNHETHIMDIDASNAAGPDVRPEYVKLYSAVEDLVMDNAFPAEWDRLARRMVDDDDLYNQFFTYYATGGEAHGLKHEVICSLVTSTNLDDTMCLDLYPEAK